MSNSNFVKIRGFPTPNAMSVNPPGSDLDSGLGLLENFGGTVTVSTSSNNYFVTNGSSTDTMLLYSNYVGTQFVVPNILGSITSVILNTNSPSYLPLIDSFVDLTVTTLGVPTVYSFPFIRTMSYPFVYNLSNSTSLPIKLQIGQTVTASYRFSSSSLQNVPTMVSLYIE